MSLKEAIRAMQTEQSINTMLCKVISVDGLLCDCEPINGDADILEVRLNASGEIGYVITPKIGSLVMVTKFERFEAFISSFSDVEKVEINCNNIVFNGGENDGLVLIGELVTKLNNLENQINDILNILKTTTIPLAPSGTYPFAPLYTSITPIAPITQKSDLENTKIKQ